MLLDKNDLKSILFNVSLSLSKKNIPCAVALILKSENETRDVIVSRIGTGKFFIINSQSVSILSPYDNPNDVSNKLDFLLKPQLLVGKLRKEDKFLICSDVLPALLELNQIQNIVNSYKSSQEICKKLLHYASRSERKDDISVAVFNGDVKIRKPGFQHVSINYLFIFIPIILILIGFFIYFLTVGTSEEQSDLISLDTFESLKLPTVIKKDTNIQFLSSSHSIHLNGDSVKKTTNQKTTSEIPKKLTMVNFTVTGSVVIISNWEFVKKEILFINWETGVSYNDGYHKYADPTSIPPSVEVTFIDNSTKIFKIKH